MDDDYDTEFEADEFDDDEFDEHEFDKNAVDTIACPKCGEEMYDDSPRCPLCGHYLTDADRGRAFPPWIIWVVFVTIVSLLLPFLLLFARMLTEK